MRLLDEKGRLFGKVNLVDLTVVLILLLGGIVTAKMFLSEKEEPVTSETLQVEIRPYTRTPWFFDAIEIGDMEIDQENDVIARILGKDSDNGLLLAEIATEVHGDDFVFKGGRVKVGSRISIETRNTVIDGVITEISIGKEQGNLAGIDLRSVPEKPALVKIQLSNRDPWLLEAIEIGDIETRLKEGREIVKAKIIGKDIDEAIVTAEIMGEEADGIFLFNGGTVKVGSRIKIETQNAVIEGVLIQVLLGKQAGELKKETDKGEKTRPAVVQVQLAAKDPWLLEAIEIGDIETRLKEGREIVKAKIIGKDIDEAIVTAEIMGEEADGIFLFNRGTVKVGSRIKIETQNAVIEGVLIQVLLGKQAGDLKKETDKGEKTRPAVVQIRLEAKDPWFLDSINKGDTEILQKNARDIVTAKILGMESQPSQIYTAVEGEIVSRQHPLKKDITLTVEIICQEKTGELFYKNNKVKIGAVIVLETENVQIHGIIADVKKIE